MTRLTHRYTYTRMLQFGAMKQHSTLLSHPEYACNTFLLYAHA